MDQSEAAIPLSLHAFTTSGAKTCAPSKLFVAIRYYTLIK